MDPDTPVNIMQATDVGLDAWRGMRAFARAEGGDGVSRCGITKAEYEEWGGERTRKWWGGNWNQAV